MIEGEAAQEQEYGGIWLCEDCVDAACEAEARDRQDAIGAEFRTE